ncbi:Uma2 family endonuclease [Amycolatopsis alkalitolerans]|uniref:Uma2 family endonuclease n=1 Tax=Amycolatopsis alkalitolerans TaxID=2547244 RepID=A0A5C4M4H6_9PSEU|nr:Uma2 family endonuclease [Amycolatopsis alkalitolerans]TNC28016.1 Uma2 family endonuclease [Amycolatopsis alkalitolerans]
MTAQLADKQQALGPVTVEDWLAADTPDDGSRLELLLGYFKMTPPATSGHQRASFRLARAIDNGLVAAGLAGLEVLQDVGVRISTPFRTALIPDLVIVKVGDSRPAFEPADVLLAAEIWSPGNRRTERETKIAAYAEAAIPYLWLVETPLGKPVSFRGYRLEEADYVQVVHAEAGETITMAAGPVPVKIDTSELC